MADERQTSITDSEVSCWGGVALLAVFPVVRYWPCTLSSLSRIPVSRSWVERTSCSHRLSSGDSCRHARDPESTPAMACRLEDSWRRRAQKLSEQKAPAGEERKERTESRNWLRYLWGEKKQSNRKCMGI